jgi:ABC-2 type transport system ATP-binding protein
VAAHRRLAYLPGEANLWPQLTGTETLHLLGRLHGGIDPAYRDALMGRFEFDPSKRVRAYSKGNRQKLVLIAALMTRADLLIMDEPTSGLDPLMEQAFRASVREAVDRGQTVFLSSHILSEVEALSSRVAILRSGQLIEVGTMAELRHLSSLSVEIDFEGPPPDLTSVPGVSGVTVEGHRVRCQVTGPMEPLLRALAGPPVRRLVSREPSLEELFLAHYGASASASVPGAA